MAPIFYNNYQPSYFNGSRRLGEAVDWMGNFNGSNWFNPYNKALSEERRQFLHMNQQDCFLNCKNYIP
jgi:hypothetical protein